MNIDIEISQKFLCQKKGEDIGDCQDAICCNLQKKRFAVADGVSSSFFPAVFSRQLTEYFCNSDDVINLELFDQQDSWKQWLANVQEKWLEVVEQEVKQSKKYYVRNRFKSNDHAGATFVGLEFSVDDPDNLQWNAMIIGDSCLIHIDFTPEKKPQVKSYLLQQSTDFNYTPKYFPSRYIKDNPYKPDFIQGHFSIKDRFLLTTDAISKWFLTAKENDDNRLNQIFLLNSDDIHTYREDKDLPLENDDVAILGLKIIDAKNKSDEEISDE